MGLIDGLGADVPVRGPECSISILMGKLDAKEQAALIAALQNPAKPNTFIARVLRDEGYNISATTVGRHRRGDCACAP